MKSYLGMFMAMDTEPAGQRVDVWFRAAALEALPPDSGACVRIGRRRIAIHRAGGDEQWYAFDDQCPGCGKRVLADGRTTSSDGMSGVFCPECREILPIDPDDGIEPSVQSMPVFIEGGHLFVGLQYDGSMERE